MSYPEFTPPDGFELPEGAEPEKNFDLVATFKTKPDGKMCLVALGGLPLTESSDASYEEGPTAGDRAMMAMKEMRGAL